MTERWGLAGGDYILFLGRLVPEKAPDLLLRAFQRVETGHRLVLAGGSSFTDGYVQRLEALAAADPRIIMAGAVHGELRDELYTNAAAFVLPSNLEGLPLTLLEAASYRLPVVASDIPPHLEVLQADAPGGRLFPRGDERGLSRTLTSVLRDLPLERGGARLIGDRVVLQYDWDAATDATEELYASLLAARWPSSPRGGAPPLRRRDPASSASPRLT
jgi:glycosyltransferase involved in cell wall biosynthesis